MPPTSSRGVRTLRSIADGRKTRTRAGALQELAALEYEKALLQRELDRWAARRREIDARLADIRAKEERLQRVAAAPPAGPPAAAGAAVRVTEFGY